MYLLYQIIKILQYNNFGLITRKIKFLTIKYNDVKINMLCGIGGIGRHARFRFLCRKTCGFKSHIPHTERAASILIVAALVFYSISDVQLGHLVASILISDLQ